MCAKVTEGHVSVCGDSGGRVAALSSAHVLPRQGTSPLCLATGSVSLARASRSLLTRSWPTGRILLPPVQSACCTCPFRVHSLEALCFIYALPACIGDPNKPGANNPSPTPLEATWPVFTQDNNDHLVLVRRGAEVAGPGRAGPVCL